MSFSFNFSVEEDDDENEEQENTVVPEEPNSQLRPAEEVLLTEEHIVRVSHQKLTFKAFVTESNNTKLTNRHHAFHTEQRTIIHKETDDKS